MDWPYTKEEEALIIEEEKSWYHVRFTIYIPYITQGRWNEA